MTCNHEQWVCMFVVPCGFEGADVGMTFAQCEPTVP